MALTHLSTVVTLPAPTAQNLGAGLDLDAQAVAHGAARCA